MTDTEILEAIIKKHAGVEPAAAAIGISRQALHVWRQDGIPETGRLKIRKYALDNNMRLPADFLDRSVA